MDIESYIGTLHSGAFVKIHYFSKCPLLARHFDRNLVKYTVTQCRIGISHDNRSVVKDARETGYLPAVNAGQRYLEWVDDGVTEKRILVHPSTGRKYLRIYPGTIHKPNTYYVDKDANKIVSFDEIKHLMKPSKIKPKEDIIEAVACYDIPLDQIIQLGDQTYGTDGLATPQA